MGGRSLAAPEHTAALSALGHRGGAASQSEAERGTTGAEFVSRLTAVSLVLAMAVTGWGTLRGMRTSARRMFSVTKAYGECRTVADGSGMVSSTGEHGSFGTEWSVFRECLEKDGHFVVLSGDRGFARRSGFADARLGRPVLLHASCSRTAHGGRSGGTGRVERRYGRGRSGGPCLHVRTRPYPSGAVRGSSSGQDAASGAGTAVPVSGDASSGAG
ncbi:hypothetical protein OHT52_14990 [Streptomyces sp. NBC_00247]|uniref:hypothetical protein n=1 Tax=Streptomyces sp. NBC_00247 TaxID=2975689 RepID=UPI002E2C79A5|nr:hypothetical protein [Streptomyces sp. NBC_00247]